MICPICGEELHIAGILRWFCPVCVKEYKEDECIKKDKEVHNQWKSLRILGK